MTIKLPAITLQFQDVALVRSFTLNLTQRLHSVEVDRRSLLSKVQHWQKEAGELRGAVEQTEILGRRVKELEGVVSGERELTPGFMPKCQHCVSGRAKLNHAVRALPLQTLNKTIQRDIGTCRWLVTGKSFQIVIVSGIQHCPY